MTPGDEQEFRISPRFLFVIVVIILLSVCLGALITAAAFMAGGSQTRAAMTVSAASSPQSPPGNVPPPIYNQYGPRIFPFTINPIPPAKPPAWVTPPDRPAQPAGCPASPQIFDFKGAPQIVPVPKGCGAAIIQAVGAGGGGFGMSGQTGGNGGFAAARIPLSGITRLLVVVGQGGDGPCRGDCSGVHVGSAFGGGAGTLEGNGGGGLSGVFNDEISQAGALVIAGGGGGGGGGQGGAGGDGGGASGLRGSNPSGGGGGSATTGGAPAWETPPYNGDQPGGPLAGGVGAYGGGGGGGYFGGGGGGRQAFWVHAGGGGGAGYVTPNAKPDIVDITGAQIGVSKDADSAWRQGVGVGGLIGKGGDGRVTITWIAKSKKPWYDLF